MTEIFLFCLAYVIIFNLIIHFRRKRKKRLKEICYKLRNEIDSTMWFSHKNVLSLINVSKSDFKKIQVMYYKMFSRVLLEELYLSLQPDHLETLEILVSKSKLNRIAKTWLLKDIAFKLRDAMFREDNLSVNELLKKLPDGSFNDLRFVYFSLHNEDLNEESFYPEIRHELKRLL